jgi:ApaG protein
MFVKSTRDIKVTVSPNYLPEQSSPVQSHFVWAYTIRLDNMGDQRVQLESRYWHITDANGMVQEVEGPGVVGEQPTLRPGDAFSYTSGVVLHTSSGIMTGHYTMKTDHNEYFPIEIPVFSLDSPSQKSRPN